MTLAMDSKNYHAWIYRLWLCKKFNLFEKERKVPEALLDQDVGNGSAWTYRYFIQTKGLKELNFSDEEVKQNLAYTKNRLEKWPENKAAWNYLLGFFKLFKLRNFESSVKAHLKDFSDFKEDVVGIYEHFLGLDEGNKAALALKVYYLNSCAEKAEVEESDKLRQQAIEVNE